MSRIQSLILGLSLFVFLASPAFADSSLYLNITPKSLVAIPSQGVPLTQSVNLKTNDGSAFSAYPIIFNWTPGNINSVYQTSTWANYVGAGIPMSNNGISPLFNFTLTNPANTATGEFYQVAAFGKQTFDPGSLLEPAIYLGVPVTIQFVSNPTPTVIPTSTAAPTSTSGVGKVAETAILTTTSTSAPKSKTVYPPGKITPVPSSAPIPTPVKPIPGKLSSLLVLEGYSYRHDFWQGKEVLTVRIKNLGNIKAQPSGWIQVKTDSGELLDQLNFNQAGDSVLPNSVREFEMIFQPHQSFIGFLKADIALGSTDTFTQRQPVKVKTFSFFFITRDLILAIILASLVILAIRKELIKRKQPILRYTGYFLVLISLGLLSSYFYLNLRRPDPQTLATQVVVTGTVPSIAAIETAQSGGSWVVTVGGNLAETLNAYSLQNGTAYKLNLAVVGGNYYILDAVAAQYPVLILIGNF